MIYIYHDIYIYIHMDMQNHEYIFRCMCVG